MSLREEADTQALIRELREDSRRAQVALAREKRRTDQLVDAVERAVSAGVRGLEIPPVEKPAHDARRKGEEVAVVWASDWQLAKVTPSYTSEVCEERVERYADRVIELTRIQRADHPVKEARLWLLGDIVEGELIFPGQAHHIDASLYRQVTVDGPRILGNLVRRMAGEFERLHVVGVIGNHGRVGGRASKDYNPETNADRMLYRVVQQLCQDEERVTWQVPDGDGERNWYAIDDIGGYRTLLFHGDQIRGGGFAGFPYYGLAKRLWGWRTGAVREPWKDAACGHWHTILKATLNDVVCRVNGTTESDNTWAAEELALSGRPAQWLTFVKPGWGTTAEYTVYLDE